MKIITKILSIILNGILIISLRASMPSNAFHVPALDLNAALHKAQNEYKKNLEEYKEMLQERNDDIKGHEKVKDSPFKNFFYHIGHANIIKDKEIIAMVENFLATLKAHGKTDPSNQDLIELRRILKKQMQAIYEIIETRKANDASLAGYMDDDIIKNNQESNLKEIELLIRQNSGNQKNLLDLQKKQKDLTDNIFSLNNFKHLTRFQMNEYSRHLVLIKEHIKELQESVDELLNLQDQSQKMAKQYAGVARTIHSSYSSQLVEQDQSRAEGESKYESSDSEDDTREGAGQEGGPSRRKKDEEFDKIIY